MFSLLIFFDFTMAKQTLVFETAKDLSLRNGMLTIFDRETEETVYRSIEDIQSVMVDNHSVRMSIPLLIKLSKLNVGVVFCDEHHMPVSMLMDLESNSIQSRRFQNQLSASKPLKKQIWKQIVEAKIYNQFLLLQKCNEDGFLLQTLSKQVKSGDSTNREAVAAKYYWKKLFGKFFIRDRYGEPPNALLNYGYALLRSLITRHLMNAGLLPTVGVFHRNCFNAFPLADDIMEPYRPFVDNKVRELVDQGISDICLKSKKALLEMFYSDIPSNAMMMTASTLAGVYEGNNKVIVFPKIS